MDVIFVPLIKSRGVKNQIKINKFKEQAFMVCFYVVSWSVGFYLAYHSPYWLDSSQFWIGYPHLEISPGIKRFYLFQIGYWLQQMVYVQIEVRRKDYLNMIVHHIITNMLMVISYYCNFTRMGHIILTLMDFSDIFLSLAKTLNYLKFPILCDATFILFVLSWVPSRHIGFMALVWSIMVDPFKYNPDSIWDPANGVFYTETFRVLILTLLLSLQVLMLIWFKMILIILFRIIKGENLKDDRSSGDESSEDEKKEK
ncbi:Sphingosine N-acyltransferase lag1 [Entomophthora muscae]|uniref:Sphingosine N-acyltransferase lag1 n=1 Tax=Entomophthora muscae TaxID=34485 RepID=A0ACC2UK02_9FUNG|nr:Sphingosine N-acyltransferase lag1 [Entomophthora muscae]